MNLIQIFEKKQLNKISEKINSNEQLTDEKKALATKELNNRVESLRVGDQVKIYYKIVENKKERIQIFEGNIISFKGNGLTKSVKVRKLSYGVGVERTFPLFSPNVAKIELVKRGKVRRSKLYFLRDRSGKSAVIKEKINFKEITE